MFAAGLILPQLGFADHENNVDLKQALEGVVPGMKPDHVEHSPISGLYELTYGPHVVYVTGDGRYLLRGDLVDLKEGLNITEQKRQQARLSALNKVDRDSMIVFGPEKAKYSVTVFTDVECGYCRMLHKQMSDYNKQGIAIRYLAFPRAGIGSRAYNTMVSVWCADDPRQAMTDAKAGKSVTPKQCANPVREHYELGRAVGVTGTPTLILNNGQVLPGFVPPDRLVQMLNGGTRGAAAR